MKENTTMTIMTEKDMKEKINEFIDRLTSLKGELDAFAEETEYIEDEFEESSYLEARDEWRRKWKETDTCLFPSYSCGLVYRGIMLLSGDDYRSHLAEVLEDKLQTAQSHLLEYCYVISGLVNDGCSAPATAMYLVYKLEEVIIDFKHALEFQPSKSQKS